MKGHRRPRLSASVSRHLLPLLLGPLLSLFIVSLGNGFIASLSTLRLDAAGVSANLIGVVSSAYFIGLTLGAVSCDRLIGRIGHIRAFSSFASLTAASFLLQGMVFDPIAWTVFRLVNGWATLGIFLVVESWLLLAGDQKTRGRLLALYMIAFYGAGMLGQAALGRLHAGGDTVPFMVAGMLASLSVLPIVIVPRIAPAAERAEPLRLLRLLRMSPTGVVGCFGSGIAIAAVYTLLPLYLQRVGMDVGQVGELMACVILGAVVLQYPIGRWSDRRDRRAVLAALSAYCALLSLFVLALPDHQTVLVVLLFLLGGGVFAVYPVAVSHAADQAPAGALVGTIQGLLLINSIGSAISPLAISPLMAQGGEQGLFWAFLVLNAGLAALFLRRHRLRPEPAPVAPFAPTTQMSPAGAQMRVTQELLQGALAREHARDRADAAAP